MTYEVLGYKDTERQRQRQGRRQGKRQIDPIEVHGSIVTLILALENGSGTDFGASQCIPMDLDAAAAAAARCVYTFRVTIILGGPNMMYSSFFFPLA